METLRKTIFEKIDPKTTERINAMCEQMQLAIGLVARLRAPDGCPWDKEQTHLTLRPYLIEEAYEVLDVLDSAEKDPIKLKEELGDLLLQILLHSQLKAEEGAFNMGDVAESLAAKLVSRHPHVFGDTKVAGTDDVLKNWEALKKKEGKKGLLDGLPSALPSLQRAARIGEKAHRVGFDWKNWQGSMLKVDEELAELKQAIAENDAVEIENEMGDLFFAICNLARHLKIQPEDAHRKAIAKFESRFKKLEGICESRGIDIHSASLETLDEVWDEVKKLKA